MSESISSCPVASDGVGSGERGPRWPGGPLRVIEFFSGIGGLRVGLVEAGEALRQSGIGSFAAEFVAAYDISATANGVYAHNFSSKPICASIEHLSLQQVDGKAQLWLLSPPCQPYTRGGKKLDMQDGRATGFLHLLQLLDSCASPPQFIFLENVRGFEGSDTWQCMQRVLLRKHYSVQHFLLSPTQIGIPNTRVRYYCLAARHTDLPKQQQQQQQQQQPEQPQMGLKQQQQPQQAPPETPEVSALGAAGLQLIPPDLNAEWNPKIAATGAAPRLRCVGEFLEKNISAAEWEALRVPADRLTRFLESEADAAQADSGEGGSGAAEDSANSEFNKKEESTETEMELNQRKKKNTNPQHKFNNGFRLELVSPSSTACGTFTKGYGRNLHSGGPLLLICEEDQPSGGPEAAAEGAAAAPSRAAAGSSSTVESAAVTTGGAAATGAAAAAAAVLRPDTLERHRFRRLRAGDSVRFFSSRELLRLHGFPETFSFPPSLPFRKKAALVGNSVNVKVVALLLQHLLQQACCSST
ncbi:DNA methyltransferase 2, putative [Eimeria necatrix]|uniref:DNA methyltransferase 2, putative n=1 Tax=Eimeria necatrix TaxID=51315 RepID=U6MS21_9EIME|nr:DNA methyltransferase 2, putative [Eimeria necatrix]CDJ65888.1 DNA methyltransferase 2, putative [Eimeria necatrix]